MPDGIQWSTSGTFSHISGAHTDVTIPAGSYGGYPFLVGGIAAWGGSTSPGENPQALDPSNVNDHTIQLIVGGAPVTSSLGGTGYTGILANHSSGGFVNFFGSSGSVTYATLQTWTGQHLGGFAAGAEDGSDFFTLIPSGTPQNTLAYVVLPDGTLDFEILITISPENSTSVTFEIFIDVYDFSFNNIGTYGLIGYPGDSSASTVFRVNVSTDNAIGVRLYPTVDGVIMATPVSNDISITVNALTETGTTTGGAVELIGIPLVISPWVETGYNVPAANPLDGGGTIRIRTNAPTVDPLTGHNTEVGTYAWAILSTLELFPADTDDPTYGPIFTNGPTFSGISALDGNTGAGIFLAFGRDFDDSEGITRNVTIATETLAQFQADGVTPSINFDPSAKYMVGVIAVWFSSLLAVDYPVASAPSWGSPATTVVSRTNIATQGQATVSIGLFTKSVDPVPDLTFDLTNAPLGDAGGANFAILGNSAISANHKPRSYAQLIG